MIEKNKGKKLSKTKIAAIITGSGFLVLFITALAISSLVDLSRYKSKIMETVNSKINGKVDLGEMRLSLWKGPSAILSNIVVEDGKGQPVLKIKKAEVALDFFSLLLLKPRTTLTISSPEITVIWNQNKRYNLTSLVAKLIPTAEAEEAKKEPKVEDKSVVQYFLDRAQFRINNSALLDVIDQLRKRNVKAGNLDFTLNNLAPNEPVEFKVGASLTSSIAGLDLSGKFSAQGVIRFSQKEEKKITSVVVKKFDLNFGPLEANASGSWEDGKIKVTASTNKFDMDVLAPFIPELEENIMAVLAQFVPEMEEKMKGMVQVNNLQVDEKLATLKNFSIKKPSPINIKAQVEVINWQVKPKGIKLMRGKHAKVDLSPTLLTVEFDIVSDETILKSSLRVEDWTTDPKRKLNINALYFDPNDFLSEVPAKKDVSPIGEKKSEKTSQKTAPSSFLNKANISGKIFIAEGKVKKSRFQNLFADFKLSQDALHLSNVRATAYEGILAANATIHINHDPPHIDSRGYYRGYYSETDNPILFTIYGPLTSPIVKTDPDISLRILMDSVTKPVERFLKNIEGSLGKFGREFDCFLERPYF